MSKIQGKSCYQYHRVDGVRDIVEVYLSTDQCDFIVAKSLQDAIDQNQPAVAPVASTPEA